MVNRNSNGAKALPSTSRMPSGPGAESLDCVRASSTSAKEGVYSFASVVKGKELSLRDNHVSKNATSMPFQSKIVRQ